MVQCFNLIVVQEKKTGDHSNVFFHCYSEQQMFDSDEAAYEEVRRGRAWGSLIFSPNFTEAMSHRVEFGANVDNISIDASEVEVKMDMSSKS